MLAMYQWQGCNIRPQFWSM